MDLGKIEKGYLGSLIVEQKLLRNGFNIFKPSMENGKVDMIIEKDNVYYKLQIKTVIKPKDRGSYIPVRKTCNNRTGSRTYLYTAEEIDYFVGVDLDTEDVYMMPVEFSSQYKGSISLGAAEEYKNNFENL